MAQVVPPQYRYGLFCHCSAIFCYRLIIYFIKGVLVPFRLRVEPGSFNEIRGYKIAYASGINQNPSLYTSYFDIYHQSLCWVCWSCHINLSILSFNPKS
jgi:hypothetical protein